MDSSFDALFARLSELSEQFNELREGIRKAVAVADLDPEMALTRARKVLEYVVRDVYERHVKQPAGTQPLENLLQRLSKDGHMPTRVEAYATAVRKLGNVGTHAFGEKITTTDVSHSLGQLLAIVEWYFEAERPDAFARTSPSAEPAGKTQALSAAQTQPVAAVRAPAVEAPRSVPTAQPAAVSPQPAGSKRGLIAAAAAAAVLLLALVGQWAGGVFNQPKPASAPLAANLDEPHGKGPTVPATDETSAATRSAPTSTDAPPASMASAVAKGSGHWRTLGQTKSLGSPASAASAGAKTAEPSPDTTKGFVPLFNGKDTTGWRPHPIGSAHWEVKDGVLVGSGGVGHLFTDGRPYENFHLRLETQINVRGNSGVYFRAPYGPSTPEGFPLHAYEAQVNCMHPDPKKTGSLFVANKPAVALDISPVKPDEWFLLEVIADGPHIVVKVNGETTADYVDAAPNARVGQLALQVHDADTVAQFRKIEIQELPAGDRRLQWVHSRGVFEQVAGNVWLERLDAREGRFWREQGRTPEFVALAVTEPRGNSDRALWVHLRPDASFYKADGDLQWMRSASGSWKVLERDAPAVKPPAEGLDRWVPLLAGKDLTGWKVAGNEAASWRFDEKEDFVGSCTAPPAGLLYTERSDYRDFHLRLQVRRGVSKCQTLVCLRGNTPNEGTRVFRGYAVTVEGNADAPGLTAKLSLCAYLDAWSPAGTRWPVLDTAFDVPVKPDDWFPMEIFAEANHLRVHINGRKVLDYIDANGTFTAGRLGLACRPGAEVRLRELEVKELAPVQPVAAQFDETAIPRAMDACEAARKKAAEQMLAAFDRQLAALPTAAMEADDRMHLIDAVKAERAAFQSRQRLPWSEPMRDATMDYLRALANQRREISLAHDKAIDFWLGQRDGAKVKEYTSKRQQALRPQVVAVWQYEGQPRGVDFLSDGTVVDRGRVMATWKLLGDSLQVRFPAPGAPGAPSAHLFRLSRDGNRMEGKNTAGARRSARLVGVGN